MLDKHRHKNIMLKILKEIYSDIDIGSILGFKGDTAAMLFYDLDRFSVDLDFDILDPKMEDIVFERIGLILKKFGNVKEARIKHNTIFFLISYEDSFPNLKIEINKRYFNYIKYEQKTYMGVSMLVISGEDMFANKLVALIDRKKIANRDIFDIWFFLDKNWDFSVGTIENRTGVGIKEYLQKSIECLKKVENTHILHGLGELVTEKQKQWVKEKLIGDTVFMLSLRLDLLK